jgi:uncharacterized alpha-E superfamily protein
MEQLLTANVATNLYWLGRYIERAESTLTQILVAYDAVIDVDKNAGIELYENFSVEIAYTNAQDFLEQAIFGDHTANLETLTGYARENAIISRNHLNTEAFGEIIALHALFQKYSNNLRETDYKLIDNALSLISEMWGEISKTQYRKVSDYFLRLGQLVEKADFNFRFDKNKEIGMAIVEDIENILENFEASKEVSDEQVHTKTPTEDMDFELVINNLHSRVESLIIN